MSACKKVTKWVVEEIQVPVEKFFEKWEERCNEYKKKVEEKVIKPMEKWVSKRRRKCKKRKWYDPRGYHQMGGLFCL